MKKNLMFYVFKNIYHRSQLSAVQVLIGHSTTLQKKSVCSLPNIVSPQ